MEGLNVRRYLGLIGGLVLGLAVWGGAAYANDIVYAEATVQWHIVPAVDVELSGTNVVILRLRAESSEMSVFAHRELIYRRLADVMQASARTGVPLTSQDVRVALPGEVEGVEYKYPAVFVADQLIVEVDPVHAAINQSTQEGLAKVWARNLGRALDIWAELNFR